MDSLSTDAWLLIFCAYVFGAIMGPFWHLVWETGNRIWKNAKERAQKESS